MRSLPEMIFIEKEDGYSGDIYLEYWQSVFGLNEPIRLFIQSNPTTEIYTDLYNYIIDNQKELLDIIISEFSHAWNEWITLSYRAKQYNNLPAFDVESSIVHLCRPYYILLDNDEGEGIISFVLEAKEGNPEIFSEFFLKSKVNNNTFSKIVLEIDEITYIPSKYRSEREEKWYKCGRLDFPMI